MDTDVAESPTRDMPSEPTTERVQSNDRGRGAERPSEIPIAGWKDIALRVKGQMRDDRTLLEAAGVAFFAFVSLVPTLAAALLAYGLVSDPADVRTGLNDLAATLPQSAQDLIDEQMQSIVTTSPGALSLGLVTALAIALWSASGAVGNLITAVNATYNEDDDRSWFVRKAIALVFTLLGLGALFVALGAIVAVPAWISSAGVPSAVGVATRVVGLSIAAAVFALLLAGLYRMAPDRRDADWRWVSPGAVAAVAVWLVATLLFQVYVTNFGSYNETYGSLAGVVILLLWLWLTFTVVLLGAQVNAEIEHQTARDTTVNGDQPRGQRDAEVADTIGQAAGRE